jgi:hypothetical protein
MARRITIRLSPEEDHRLRHLMALEQKTMSAIVRAALEQYRSTKTIDELRVRVTELQKRAETFLRKLGTQHGQIGGHPPNKEASGPRVESNL